MYLSFSRWDAVAETLAALGLGAKFGARFTVVRTDSMVRDKIWGFAWDDHGERRAIFIDGGEFVAHQDGRGLFATWVNEQHSPTRASDLRAQDEALAALGVTGKS